jgi:hypothetical protein
MYNIFMNSLLVEQLNKNLTELLTIRIYEGFITILNCTTKFYAEYQKTCAIDKNMKPLTETEIFLKFLEGMKLLDDTKKVKAYENIKKKITIDCLDELIYACLKSNYEFYAQTNFDNVKQYSLQKFINDCYLKCIEYFEKMPELFLKKNRKNEIFEIIEKSILNVIFNTVITKEILENYLENKKQTHNIAHYIKQEDKKQSIKEPDYPIKHSNIINENSQKQITQQEFKKYSNLQNEMKEDTIIESMAKNDSIEDNKVGGEIISFLSDNAFNVKSKKIEAYCDLPTAISSHTVQTINKVMTMKEDALDNYFINKLNE